MKFKLNEKIAFKNSIKKPNLNFSWIRNIRADAAWGLLSYFHLLVILPYFIKRKDEFVQFHVKQGLAALAIWIILIFSFYLPVLPWIVALFLLIMIISGIANVLLGKKRILPLIGKFAERF